MRWLLFLTMVQFAWSRPGTAQDSVRNDTAVVISRNALANGHLVESSALIRSQTQPGVFWTLNDSGNPAELFAIDTAGHDLGVFRVEGAENRDWESLGYARCGSRMCLYIGDTGDNRSRYPAVEIYRVPEPVIRPGETGHAVRANGKITITYPDGPRDVEAMFVSPASDIYLISKGRTGGVRLYMIRATTWTSPMAGTVAQFVETLPIPAGRGGRYQVTDASLAADGIHVAIRTYAFIYFFQLAAHHLTAESSRPTCDAQMDVQGEGIAWLADGTLATTSERVAVLGKTISVVRCSIGVRGQ
ncbi:MAG: hypothetical protein ABI613_03835 [Gemmatimonadota bacterium]